MDVSNVLLFVVKIPESKKRPPYDNLRTSSRLLHVAQKPTDWLYFCFVSCLQLYLEDSLFYTTRTVLALELNDRQNAAGCKDTCLLVQKEMIFLVLFA